MISGTLKGSRTSAEWRDTTTETIARYVMIHYDRYECEMTVESLMLGRETDAEIHEFRL